MSDTAGTEGTASEAYAFVCMKCGYGWEQTYEIHHHTDLQGRPYVTYIADGERVPSPLARPTCLNCEGHLIRIMPSGRVSEAVSFWESDQGERRVHHSHHWSPLHLLHRRGGGEEGV
jgi:hypothetical protein